MFIDADVQLQGLAVASALAESRTQRLALLSVFPDQIMKTWGERVVVPIMHYLLLTLLPLRFVRDLPFPSMAAANGQFMFFEAAVYRKFQFHEQVRREVTEDIEIVRFIKRQRLRAGTYLGNQMILCRMYDSFESAAQGFSKNLLAGFGNYILGLLGFLCLISLGYGAAFMQYFWAALIILITLTSGMNLMLARLSNQSATWLILLHPLKVVALVWIGLSSIRRKLTKNNTWKGRVIS